MSWSFDDKHIGMFFPPEAVIIEIKKPANTHYVRGTGFQWTGESEIVFLRDNDIYRYDMKTGKTVLFLKNAVQPVFAREND